MALPATPAGPVVSEPVKPSAAWFWVGGALVVAAGIGAIAWFVLGFIRLDDTIGDFARVPADRGGPIELDAGEYVIYEEGAGAGLLGFASAVEVTGPEGDPIPTAPYVSELTYDFNGRSGAAAATFTAPGSGIYELGVDSVGDPSGFGPSTLAVGKSVGGDLVWAILGGFLIGGIGVLVGIVILIVTGARRAKVKRDRRQALHAVGQPAGTWGAQPQAPLPPLGQPPPPAGPPVAPPADAPGAPVTPTEPPPRNPDPPPPPGWTAP